MGNFRKGKGVEYKYWEEVKEFFEPMFASKYLTIASGATPNGSADRATDEI
jgi:hypothetical protein